MRAGPSLPSSKRAASTKRSSQNPGVAAAVRSLARPTRGRSSRRPTVRSCAGRSSTRPGRASEIHVRPRWGSVGIGKGHTATCSLGLPISSRRVCQARSGGRRPGFGPGPRQNGVGAGDRCTVADVVQVEAGEAVGGGEHCPKARLPRQTSLDQPVYDTQLQRIVGGRHRRRWERCAGLGRSQAASNKGRRERLGGGERLPNKATEIAAKPVVVHGYDHRHRRRRIHPRRHFHDHAANAPRPRHKIIGISSQIPA